MKSKDFDPKGYVPIGALKVSFEENGILIDRRILSAVEDLDAALTLCFVLWVEMFTRAEDNGRPEDINPAEPWMPPKGCDVFSHWFAFNYADTVDLFERALSKIRLRSCLKWLITDLGIIETRRQRGTFPSIVEYRVNYDKLVLWMTIPRPEDYTVFQRDKPQKRRFIVPKIHPHTGKTHSWHTRGAVLKRQRQQRQVRKA